MKNQYPNPVAEIQQLYLALDRLERRSLLEWLWTRCETCGREGRWDGKPWQAWKGGPPPQQGNHCDACCDNGQKQI